MLIVADTTLTPPPTIGESKVAVAAAPTCFGAENVTVGEVAYPAPGAVKVTIPTPPVVEIPTVAIAPEPVLEINLTPGKLVYPLPEFKI